MRAFSGSSLPLALSADPRGWRQKRILNPVKCSHCIWLSWTYLQCTLLFAGAQPELQENSAKC